MDDAVLGVGVQPVEAAPSLDEGALGVDTAVYPGMPTPYGITRACPFTKIVRWVWTWVTVFSPALHWIPSTD